MCTTGENLKRKMEAQSIDGSALAFVVQLKGKFKGNPKYHGNKVWGRGWFGSDRPIQPLAYLTFPVVVNLHTQCHIFYKIRHSAWTCSDWVILLVVDTNNYGEITDNNLCLDSNVSHHITPNVDSITDVQQYEGIMSILSSDGKILNIAYTGIVELLLPNYSILQLKNTHCIPKLCKYLISIQKLTNDFPYEFSLKSNIFCIKDS